MNKQFTLRAIIMIVAIVTTIVTTSQYVGALRTDLDENQATSSPRTQAPIATSGDNNVYIAWWTNKTGNDEVMFRASTDNGATFGDNLNLSNSTKTDSQDAQIDASGDRVFVTWWERNATSNEPVLRISNDNGKTFGEIFRLSDNGTIGSNSIPG